MKGIGYYSIIVLIVLIVTACLNEAKHFSLFNATQILGIPIGEIQAEKIAVVFIVLIVIIVTGCLNEAMCFLCLTWCKFCTLKIKTDQALTVTMSRHSNDLPQFPLYAPRRVAVFEETDLPVTYLTHL